MHRSLTLFLIAAAFVAGVAATQPTTQPDPHGITWMTVPTKFPGIGNFDAVQKWHIGRIQQIDRIAQSPDITLRIRTMDNKVHHIIGPRDALRDLAWQSKWTSNQVKQMPGRADIVERQILFDADQTGRLIAMISLEPMYRDKNRLARGIGD